MERSVKRERLGEAAEGVSIKVESAIGEIRQIAQGVGAQERSGGDAGISVLVVAGVHAGLECVLALVPGKVVVDLEMTYVPAVGKRSRAHRGKAAAIGAAFAEGDRVRHERLRLAEILDAKQSGVPQVRGVERVDDRRRDHPGMRKASLGGR